MLQRLEQHWPSDGFFKKAGNSTKPRVIQYWHGRHRCCVRAYMLIAMSGAFMLKDPRCQRFNISKAERSKVNKWSLPP